MSDKSKIEWTDATWNPITGCSLVSAGCTNCYAMTLAGTRLRNHATRIGLTRDTKTGPVWTGAVRFNESVLNQPLKWRRPRDIFVCAHGDLYHEKILDEWIDRIIAVMTLSPWHRYQILTKRAARMRQYWQDPHVLDRIEAAGGRINDWPLPNVWLGVSIEDQDRADERLAELVATPAAVRFVSCEPLLAYIDLSAWLGRWTPSIGGEIHWVIVGGESGPRAWPMHPDWARAIRDLCVYTDTPFFFKQWGSWRPAERGAIAPRQIIGGNGRARSQGSESVYTDDVVMMKIGKKRAGRTLDNQIWSEKPK